MPRRVPTFHPKVLQRSLLVTALGTVFLWLADTGGASADAFLPPPHKIFAGVARRPISSYVDAVGKHPAVYEVFSAWGEYLPAIFQDAARARARLMIHITTGSGTQQVITPGGIAAGHGDGWLIAMNHAMFASGRITYVRLMAEMDGSWNRYSAYNADGSRRDAAHSTATFRRAWKRVTLILRGGGRSHIDSELRRLGMPSLHASADLPRPQVAMLWVPQVAGAPDIAGNQPHDYWPGRQWVDWVGTDFYGKFPNFFGLTALYNAYPGQPFTFGEYALWGSDDPGFVDRLFGWIGSHPRARMLIYNQGLDANGPFRLSKFPHAARELGRLLSSAKSPAFAPDLAP